MKVLTQNSSSKDQVKRAARIEHFRADDYKKAIISVLSTADGQTLIRQLLNNCLINHHCVGNTTEETYLNLGARNVGLKLINDIKEYIPEVYSKIMLGDRYEQYY